MLLGRFKQQPNDAKLYQIDYTDYLSETLPTPGVSLAGTPAFTVEPTTTPPLDIQDIAIDSGNPLAVNFRVTSGLDLSCYKVTVLATFDSTEEVEDEIEYDIEDI